MNLRIKDTTPLQELYNLGFRYVPETKVFLYYFSENEYMIIDVEESYQIRFNARIKTINDHGLDLLLKLTEKGYIIRMEKQCH